MRKTLYWLFTALLFATLPALAQRNSGHESHGNSFHGAVSGHTQFHGNAGVRQHGNGERPNVGVRQRGNDSRGGEQPRGYQGRGYNYSHGRGVETHNQHWDGRHFEHGYFGQHWGHDHRFFWGRCNWWGPRFGVGSWFWYNDAYFVIVDPIPDYWYDDEVYVDEYDGAYYLMDPLYPGVRFALRVRTW